MIASPGAIDRITSNRWLTMTVPGPGKRVAIEAPISASAHRGAGRDRLKTIGGRKPYRLRVRVERGDCLGEPLDVLMRKRARKSLALADLQFVKRPVFEPDHRRCSQPFA